jgi:acetylornithine deacetylase/succinyl-diaminopimelate desuccinylase-like protein
VIKNDRLYGRGASEGGFSLIVSLLMLKALQERKSKYNKTILFFETDKESGSKDLWYYYKKHEYILKPDVIYCLDGSVADYEHFYLNQSFKGLVKFDMKVQVGTTDVHSGLGGGLIPDSYRIGTDLLEQLQNSTTGKMIDGFSTEIPRNYSLYLRAFMDKKGKKLDYGIKFSDYYKPQETDNTCLFLKSVWEPNTVFTGFGNVPNMLGGNVLRGFTTFRNNLYFPPLLNAEDVQTTLTETFSFFFPFKMLKST